MTKPYYCEACNRDFSTESNFEQHINGKFHDTMSRRWWKLYNRQFYTGWTCLYRGMAEEAKVQKSGK